MTILIIGLVLFFGIHLVATIPKVKALITSKVGDKGYKGIHALISFVGLGLIIWGYGNKPLMNMPEWVAPGWVYKAVLPLLWVAVVLQPASHMKTNIKRFTRHPMLWGIVIWSGVHLWLNGDHASILLFGSFFLYSLWAMFAANKRGVKKQTQKVPLYNDVIVVIVGTVAFVALAHGHKWFAGVSLM
jgi:uncharacterized membrane protein